MRALALILFAACLACNEPPEVEKDMGANVEDLSPVMDCSPAPDLAAPRPPELLAMIPMYMNPVDTANPGPIRDHRAQLIASGDLFVPPILPQHFSFWTRYTGVAEPVRVDYLVRFTGCITRGRNSAACDVLIQPAARWMAFELCYRDRVACLPVALIVD